MRYRRLPAVAKKRYENTTQKFVFDRVPRSHTHGYVSMCSATT